MAEQLVEKNKDRDKQAKLLFATGDATFDLPSVSANIVTIEVNSPEVPISNKQEIGI